MHKRVKIQMLKLKNCCWWFKIIITILLSGLWKHLNKLIHITV